MLKSLLLKVMRLLVLTLLLIQVSWSTALAQDTASPDEVNPQPPEVVNPSPVNPPVPESPKVDEKTVTPSAKPESKPKTSGRRSAYPQSPHPYDLQAIEEFNQELYGAGN